MQTISIISLKGGVAKTTTAVNMAYTLAAVHNKKVLIIDNDKQGNTSKAFKKYDTEDKNTVARMMLERNIDVFGNNQKNRLRKHRHYNREYGFIRGKLANYCRYRQAAADEI